MKIFAILLFAAQLSALAGTNFLTQIFTNEVSIPTPEGYVEVGAEHRKAFPGDSPNALLGWFVRTNDLETFSATSTNFLTHHLQVQTVKAWTNRVMSDKSFAQFLALNLKQNAEETESVMEEAQALVDAVSTNALKIAAPKQMGTFFKTDKAMGSLMLVGYTVTTPEGPKRIPMVVGNAIVHIGNKSLFLYDYEFVNGAKALQPALEKVRGRLKPWVEATLKANE